MMEQVMTDSVLGLSPEMTQGLSLGLFILAALMFMLVIFAAMKRRAKGQTALPGAAIMLLVIGMTSFVGALILKLS